MSNSNRTLFLKLQNFGFSEPFAELWNRTRGVAAVLMSISYFFPNIFLIN